ncbi:hypothetical protein [Sphingobium naphthae]|uniref:hypothetical protein n=1 Tax=Sphingobium naphthae TaxID=1886786 RepID=UPI003748B725
MRALDVLREAAAMKSQARTRGVALALWVLRGHCPDEWLVAFWDAAGSDHEIGRSQGMHAAYNGIVRQVRTSGALADAQAPRVNLTATPPISK